MSRLAARVGRGSFALALALGLGFGAAQAVAAAPAGSEVRVCGLNDEYCRSECRAKGYDYGVCIAGVGCQCFAKH